jgi:GWxTD domain-containing protein
MRVRVLMAVAALVMAATSGMALSFEHIDWFNGPVQFIMSKDEIGIWRSLKSDAEAEAFIELFWARRDPTPDTPRNEAKELFETRVAWADKNLKDAGRKRGSLTDRGKTFILYGSPKRIEGTNTERSPRPVEVGGLQKDQRVSDNWMQWIYESEDMKNIFLVPKVTVRFVDRMGNDEYHLERGNVDMNAAQQRAITRMILHPELKAPPVFSAAAIAAEAARPADPPAAPAPSNALATPELAAAVAEFKAAAANPYAGKAFASWGEYVTSFGEYFVPVMVSVPKSSGLAADQEVTFFGVIENESGQPVLAFEETEKLHAAKDELFVDRSLALPAGKHRGIFGVAVAGKPVAITSTNMALAGSLDKDAAAASPVILSNYVQPMTEAQAPTEPFAFGGVKVVPKADKVFRPADELWYFFELRNPGLADAIAPTEGTATGAPPEQKPKVQVKVEVEGKDAEGKPSKRSAPPREVDPVPMKGVPGHYGVGNAIPLQSFKPGDYTITLKVIDTVKKASYTLTETFKIVP